MAQIVGRVSFKFFKTQTNEVRNSNETNEKSNETWSGSIELYRMCRKSRF